MDQSPSDTKYRMYVDESGTHSYSASEAVGKRYLALIGVAIREDHNRNDLQPRFRNLKSIITQDPDEGVGIHRQEIANRQGVFSRLLDKPTEARWNKTVLSIIRDLNFVLFTVVLDKHSHQQRYKTPMHPYHYCFSVLLECYVDYLLAHSGRGDVMVEGRGKKEDIQLSQEYLTAYKAGGSHLDGVSFRKVLTSKSLKIKTKTSDITGLELADLLVLASNLDVLTKNNVIEGVNSRFTQQIIPLLQPKYYLRVQAKDRREPCCFLIA